MNLKEPLYLVTIADCGSVTKAARQLGVTQPALSSYLCGIEANLGFPLFERRPTRLVPTYLGEVYLEKARKILALGREFEEQVARVVSGYQGRIRVGIPLRRSPYLIPSAMKVFQSYYPNIQVTLEERNQGELLNLLENNQLDVLLCNMTTATPGLCITRLYRDVVLFVVHGEHTLCHRSEYRADFPYPWIDLKLFQDELFFLQHPEQSLRHLSDLILEESGVKPSKVQLIRNIETAAQMAANGLGLSFSLESYLWHMHFVHQPKVFCTGIQPIYAEFSAVYREDKVMPDYIWRFIEIIRELMGMGFTGGFSQTYSPFLRDSHKAKLDSI